VADTVPKWAFEEISEELPTVREAGECTSVDFKEAFPDQAHQLGKEIAAMASSGGGRIYIGVNDNGDLCGLNLNSGDERDDAAERAHSIARNIKPTPIISLHFAVESESTVLVIDVQKQQHPVFYYDYRPYVRDGRRARPAEPNEVVKLVWAHPSSEHQRAIERLQEQQMQDFATSSRERQRRHDESIDQINRSNFR
jgi:ATP-dependent DNA helicase RecG